MRLSRFGIVAAALGLAACSGLIDHDEAGCEPADRSCEAIHWDLDEGCVTTSVHTSLADLYDDLAAIVAAWSAAECSPLCVAPPELTDAALDPALDTHHAPFVPST